MKVCMLFEDSEESILGKLLLESYNRENLYFSKSNTRLYKKAKILYEKYDIILMFFDLSPNNKDLLIQLEKLCAMLYEGGLFDKVHIVPIICSEYIYIKSITEHLGIEVNGFSLEDSVNYPKSCEKYYKHLIRNMMIGTYSVTEPDLFYVGYPVFDVVNEEHKNLLQDTLGIEVKETSFIDVGKKVVDFYNYLYSLFNLSFEDDVLSIGVKLF